MYGSGGLGFLGHKSRAGGRELGLNLSSWSDWI